MVSGQLSGKTVSLRGNFSRGQLSGRQFSSGAIILGGNCPRGQLSVGKLSSGEIFQRSNYPGDNHPGGNYSGAIFPGRNLMKMIIYIFRTQRRKNPVSYLRSA